MEEDEEEEEEAESCRGAHGTSRGVECPCTVPDHKVIHPPTISAGFCFLRSSLSVLFLFGFFYVLLFLCCLVRKVAPCSSRGHGHNGRMEHGTDETNASVTTNNEMNIEN